MLDERLRKPDRDGIVRDRADGDESASGSGQSAKNSGDDAFDVSPSFSPVSAEDLGRLILEKLRYSVGKSETTASKRDWLTAAMLAIRDHIIDRWIAPRGETDGKKVYYLSMEFLIGRLLRDAMSNLGLEKAAKKALARHGVDLDSISLLEPDAALGNGGLGRLAACFMESMASTGVAGQGYGIRYAHGLFRQEIVHGAQVELPETWLDDGNPWEFERTEAVCEIGYGGRVEAVDGTGNPPRFVWHPDEVFYAVPYDTPIVGWRGRRVNALRLWDARPVEPIVLGAFNSGDHLGALRSGKRAKAITRVLYPGDSHQEGQELRLRQEYFFSSASLQDILRTHLRTYGTLANLAEKVAIQLNDTHPAISVAELMRLLVDVHGFVWDHAWEITRGTFSYTNHTLLPEALEAWPVHLFEQVLPRHLQIIYEINARLLDAAGRERGFDLERIRSISLIDEDNGRRVRMGNLAFVGSHAVNGVSDLHTRLMKETVFRDLHALYPDRIRNKTNGITPRRWLMQCNPALAHLIESRIGPAFRDDALRLADLEPFARDAEFLDRFAAVKHENKRRLAAEIAGRTGIAVNAAALFDVQVKRIHEYKRQLLNILETIALYLEMRTSPDSGWSPRVKLFAGKAAPGYAQAKQIIRLINDVAAVVNADPLIGDRLKVVFMPNYNVSLAELIMPAADISEQISTAGFEASGTGNMKLALNGALTVGTLDGANIEILEHVGSDNIFIFGLSAEEVAMRRREGGDARTIIEHSPLLQRALEEIFAGTFSPGEPGRHRNVVESLAAEDTWMVAADFESYWATQRRLDALWSRRKDWNAKAVLNVARTGWFSSDRTIREYAQDIWGAAAN